MKVWGFEWDENNIEKIANHDLSEEEVEYVFYKGNPIYIKHPRSKRRWYALGFTPDQFIVVVFEYNAQTRWIRVVTAYEPTSDAYWRIYAQKKNN